MRPLVQATVHMRHDQTSACPHHVLTSTTHGPVHRVCSIAASMNIRSWDSRSHHPAWRLRIALGVALVLVGARAPTIAADADVRVSIRPRVLFAGQDTHVIVRVTPDDENRLLRVELDGPAYYASTEMQLDGAEAARTHDVWWRTLPAGSYVMWVRLERAGARPVVQQFSLTVAGSESRPAP
jgi:hypothetical protein